MRQLSTAAAVIVLAGLLAGPSSGEELRTNPEAKQEQAQPGAPAPFLTILDSWQAESILGKDVRGPTNENIGRIVDVVVDHRGHARAAIIDFGGFLGVGSRKIAVDWDALKFAPAEDGRSVVTLDLTREQMKSAPEYKEKRPVLVLGAAMRSRTPDE
jgi:PRC-barrel domain protein